MLQHLLHARRVLGHVHVLDGHLTLAVLLTGGCGIGSGVLPEDPHSVGHGLSSHSSSHQPSTISSPQSVPLCSPPSRLLALGSWLTASHIHHDLGLPAARRAPDMELVVGGCLDVADDRVTGPIDRLTPDLGRQAVSVIERIAQSAPTSPASRTGRAARSARRPRAPPGLPPPRTRRPSAALHGRGLHQEAPEGAGGLTEDGRQIRAPRPDARVGRDREELESTRVLVHPAGTIACPGVARKSQWRRRDGASLVAQRLDGVQIGGFPGGKIAEEDADERRRAEGHRDGGPA